MFDIDQLLFRRLTIPGEDHFEAVLISDAAHRNYPGRFDNQHWQMISLASVERYIGMQYLLSVTRVSRESGSSSGKNEEGV